MRDIKYKALYNKRIFDVISISWRNGKIIKILHRTLENINKISKPSEVRLLQYTGIKDNTGVEIYEGDILFDEYSEECGTVNFDECKFNVVFGNVCEDLFEYADSCHIIGNTYEI